MATLFDYDFECMNIDDYILKLQVKVDSRLLKMILEKSIEKIKRSKGINVSGDIDSLDRVDVDKHYWKLIKTGISGTLKKVESQLKDQEHDIKLLNHAVFKMFFVKVNEKSWMVNIEIIGQYVDKKR